MGTGRCPGAMTPQLPHPPYLRLPLSTKPKEPNEARASASTMPTPAASCLGLHRIRGVGFLEPRHSRYVSCLWSILLDPGMVR